MRRLLHGVAAGALALAGVMLVWVWFAPSDPARWHLDPLAASGPEVANDWRAGSEGMRDIDAASPAFRVPAPALAAELDRVALAEPRTVRLAGGPEALWTTYVQRSRWLGFPDYVSVRAIPLGDGSATLAIYSRARYGHSDFGVNRARVERWLAAVADRLG